MNHHPPDPESHAERAGQSGRSTPRQVLITSDHDMWFSGYNASHSRDFAAHCGPCRWSTALEPGHSLADLINLYVQHAGLDAAKELVIATLARHAAAEPELAPPVHGDEPVCGVRGPEGRFRCACHPGHPGDHVAWGSEVGNGRPFTWPQPFDEFHEYPAPAGDLDDAGDDITDALVPHSEVAHELGECDCPDTAQPADIPHTECMASAPTHLGLVCTLPPGHQGDHEAHGINCFAPPYETWPHTAGLPVPAEAAR